VNSYGEGSRTPHNHLVRLKTISNHELNITAAPSRLRCRKTPKSNKKSAVNSKISATRCKSLNNALDSHSISLEYATKKEDEWRKYSLAQSMPQVFRSARENPQSLAMLIFISYQTNRAV
jgi:hypothetical protein